MLRGEPWSKLLMRALQNGLCRTLVNGLLGFKFTEFLYRELALMWNYAASFQILVTMIIYEVEDAVYFLEKDRTHAEIQGAPLP